MNAIKKICSIFSSVFSNKQSIVDIDKSFQQYFADKGIKPDAIQLICVKEFNEFYQQILTKNRQTIGIYLWGDVGTGKTLMMNGFFQMIKLPKIRLHHHELFKNLMNDLHQFKNSKSPLESAMEAFSKKYQIACFDDLHLNDIADAKLWQGIFEQAQKNGMFLVITSNTPINQLLDTPGYREKMQSFIDTMNQKFQSFNLDNKKDYRTLIASQISNQQGGVLLEKELPQLFKRLSGQTFQQQNLTIIIQNRPIKTITQANKVICFSLEQICGTIRSYNDYIEIIQNYRCLIITQTDNNHQLTNPLILQRFIWLIDIIYDKEIRFFYLSKQSPISILLSLNHSDIKRTISRLKQLFKTNED